MIQWKKSYSIGIAKLDEQHKNLFQYCNDLEDILKDGKASKHVLDFGLKFLEKYARDHFGEEETCMHKFACPLSANNKSAHKEFIETYKSYEKRLDEDLDPKDILKEIHFFLENWLTNHIAKVDVELKPCVDKKTYNMFLKAGW